MDSSSADGSELGSRDVDRSHTRSQLCETLIGDTVSIDMVPVNAVGVIAIAIDMMSITIREGACPIFRIASIAKLRARFSRRAAFGFQRSFGGGVLTEGCGIFKDLRGCGAVWKGRVTIGSRDGRSVQCRKVICAGNALRLLRTKTIADGFLRGAVLVVILVVAVPIGVGFSRVRRIGIAYGRVFPIWHRVREPWFIFEITLFLVNRTKPTRAMGVTGRELGRTIPPVSPWIPRRLVRHNVREPTFITVAAFTSREE